MLKDIPKNLKYKMKFSAVFALTFAIFAGALGFTFAFFSASVKEINKKETIMVSNELLLTFEGTKEINCSNIIPGDECSKEFTIENKSNRSVNYNIYMQDILNEFDEDLVYTLEDENGIVINEIKAPSSASKEYIKLDVDVAKESSKQYKLVVKFLYLENKNQNINQGKKFNAIVGVDTNQVKRLEDVIEYESLSNINKYCNESGMEITLDEEVYSLYCGNNEIELVKIDKSNSNSNNESGNTLKIAHDIYFADENKYSNGLNERYELYCTPYSDGETYGVKYCDSKDSNICKNVSNRDSCNYDKAAIDFGYSSINTQKMQLNFADEGNGNWHIQTFCSNDQKKELNIYDNGVYYCNEDATLLHDWYNLGELPNLISLKNDNEDDGIVSIGDELCIGSECFFS